MIHVNKLVKRFGSTLAVDRIDLDVAPGQIVGFLGPNGAGKTTTIRMITCFLPPTAGTATVDGHDILADSDAVRRCIGYLPEATPLYPEMKVTEQLHFSGRLHGMDRATRRHRIADLTDHCGLEKILHRPIGQLSKGNKQRVGLAQAMLHDPPVLILDEPTSGLDPAQITDVRNLIRSLAHDKTILLSTHILPEVEKTCERVVIIAQGSIVADGTPEELIRKKRSASRVLVELKADAASVERAFAAIRHVGKVEATADGAWTRAAVTPRSHDFDVRELLADAALEHGWPIREMRHEVASLEEYFIQVTSAASIEAA
ncbi:MAG: ATP-binding cassette domain-containing protein [Phycisphaera sp.]|nr:ATP-binding cassette domain-containing protein [Phycisphaera sp.]